MSKTILEGITKSKIKIDPKGKKMPNHWSLGLVGAMEDPELIVSKDDKTVTIKDKYPKAKHHYLILPKEEITGISKLEKSHLPLLYHMQDVANKLKKQMNISCKIGFHSVPSMQRLHLHVISDDFVSPCLKTKVHWNSYTTEFFILSKNLIKMIEDNGKVSIISTVRHKELMSTPLKCHKCNFEPKNMPNLKEHLLTHITIN